jgi:hypothetical protein
VAPLDPLLIREQTVANKLNGFIINFVVRRLCQLSQHVNNQHLYFFRLQKAKQDGSDKGDHDSIEVEVTVEGSTGTVSGSLSVVTTVVGSGAGAGSSAGSGGGS